MNLFLRLLLVWLKARFKPHVDYAAEVVTRFRVWPTDQDMFRHMTNSRYFSLTDVCIVDYMLRTGAWPILSRRGWLPIVAYEDLAFRRMLRFPRRFCVRTRLLGWDEAYVVLSHVFERADGVVAAEGFTVSRFVSKKGERVPTADVVAALDPEMTAAGLSPAAIQALERAKSGYEITRGA
ncbi:MAG: thioesterase family protein [Maricaulaceae bacterium]